MEEWRKDHCLLNIYTRRSFGRQQALAALPLTCSQDQLSGSTKKQGNPAPAGNRTQVVQPVATVLSGITKQEAISWCENLWYEVQMCVSFAKKALQWQSKYVRYIVYLFVLTQIHIFWFKVRAGAIIKFDCAEREDVVKRYACGSCCTQ
jgi:hypothetical protein